MWHRITRGEAITGMVGLRRRCSPRNDGSGVAALVRTTWMVGLRRRCSPRNDGSGVDALVRTTWMAGLRRRYSPRSNGDESNRCGGSNK
ncbi:MAG: hypothetical protein HON55_04195 [Legionellales bacterium]|nr:hypothetical protein [Legionellales bacterium]